MSFRIELVSDTARFETVQGAWQQVWERSGAHIFQTHDWLSGWLAGMRDHKEIRIQIALAWDGGSIAGIMPCAIHRHRSGLRILRWAAELFSDYCDCILDPAYGTTSVLRRLWEGIDQAGGFDLVSLQQIKPDAQCRALLNTMAENNGPLQHAARQERCMRIDNKWPDGTAFFRSLNKKARNNHTRGKRILAELSGEVALQVLQPDHPAAEVAIGEDPVGRVPVATVIEEILRLKENWLREADPKSPLFGHDGIVLRAILDTIWRSGFVKIFLLTCGGKIAAASINFDYGHRMEAYLTSYDTAYERASPGTILIVEYTQWSFDRGLGHVDFLRGEEAFKFRMANAEITLNSFSGSRTVIGRVALSGHRWWSRRRQRRHVTVVPEADAELAALP